MGKGHQGACRNGTWTKPKVVGSRVGGEDMWGRGCVERGKREKIRTSVTE